MEFAGVNVISHEQQGVIELLNRVLFAIEGVGRNPNKVSLADGCWLV